MKEDVIAFMKQCEGVLVFDAENTLSFRFPTCQDADMMWEKAVEQFSNEWNFYESVDLVVAWPKGTYKVDYSWRDTGETK